MADTMTDTERLDILERYVNKRGALLLHTGDANCHEHAGLGLRPGYLRRTLREAIDRMAESDSRSKETL